MNSRFSIFKAALSKSNQRGFSLLEIIIVLAIIGMLVGIIVSRLAGNRESASISLTGTKAANLYGKIIQYQLMNNNQFPPNLATLESGVNPVITPDEATDAWGHEFCYNTTNPQSGDVYLGSKGKEGIKLSLCFKNGQLQKNTGGATDNSLDGCTPC